MESMTGYAYLEKKTDQFSFSIEIKSLNSKHLEVFSNIPRILRKNEEDILFKLKEKFSRGKIVITIEIFDWTKEKPVSINKELIKQYYKELKDIEKNLHVDNFFSGDILFNLDYVIQKERTFLSPKSYTDIINTLNIVIDKSIKMRMKDGNATKKDILKSLSVITNDLNKIKVQAKDVANDLYNKLKTNIESLTENKVEDVRIYTEIAIQSAKLDINEEIIRLNDHIEKFKSTANRNDQIGKSLDFLSQEMFREVNTIASKANSSSISHLAVDMKNHLEKIREHCRNIV